MRLAYACSPGKENALFLLPPPPFGATIQGGLVRRDNLSSVKDHPQVNCRQVGNKHPQRGIAGAGAVPFTGANVTAMLLVARRDLPDQCWGELQGTGNRPVSHQYVTPATSGKSQSKLLGVESSCHIESYATQNKDYGFGDKSSRAGRTWHSGRFSREAALSLLASLRGQSL